MNIFIDIVDTGIYDIRTVCTCVSVDKVCTLLIINSMNVLCILCYDLQLLIIQDACAIASVLKLKLANSQQTIPYTKLKRKWQKTHFS